MKRLLLIFLFVLPAFATTRFISPSGTNTGTCTNAAAPCADIAYAYGQAAAGDDIQAANGTYNGNMSITGPAAKPGATVVIHAAAGGVINVSGGWGINQSTNNIEVDDLTATGVGLQDTSNVVFRRVRAMHGVSSAGWFLANAHNFQCFQCEIGFQDPGDGLKFFVSANGVNSNILFDGLFEHDLTRVNCLPGDVPPCSNTAHQDGIETEAANNVTIQNSTFWNISTQGFYVVCDLPNCGITNVTFINNFVGPAQLGFNSVNLRGGSSIFVKYNTFVGSSQFVGPEPSNTHFVGNILAGFGGQVFSCTSLAGAATEFKYNVIELPAGNACGDSTNLVRQNVNATLTNPNAGSAATFDLHLLAGSPAIDSGSPTDFPATDHDGQTRPVGALADSGADEFGLSSGPNMSYSPISMDFATQTVGTASASKLITYTNNGTTSMTLSGLSITGAGAGSYTSTTTCGASLAVNASCTASVTFNPIGVGPQPATIAMADNASGSPHGTALTGIGLTLGANVTLTPSSLSFGLIAINQSSSPQTITVSNYGGVTLNSIAIAITGTDASQFTKTTTCGTTLSSNTSCTVSVTFSPLTLGAKNATLLFTDSASTSPQSAGLSGTAVAVPPIAFKSYTDNEPSGTGTTVTAGTVNLATGDAIVACVGASATQTINGITDGAGNVLTRVKRATGTPGTLEMWWKPNAVANANATFTATYAASASSRLLTVGTYVGLPTAVVDQTSCNSAGCDTSANSLVRTAINVTTTAANELEVGCSWDSGSTFYNATNNFNLRSVGLHGAISMDYQHTDRIVSQSGLAPNGNIATNSVTTNWETVFATFGVTSGTATLSAAPSPLNFGSVGIGANSTLTTTISNTGSADATITSNTITGTNSADFVKNNICGSTITAGSSCDIAVVFTPTLSGAETAAINILSNAAPLTVNLTGTGAIAAPTIAPTSLTFPNTNVGSNSVTQNVTITNNSTAAITFTSIVAAGDYLLLSNTCGANLGGSASCVLGIAFNPSTTGVRTGTVTLTDNAAGSPQVINLTGTGIAAAVTFAPTSLSFGSQLLNQTTASQTITMTNTGAATLTITAKSVTGDFAQVNSCGATLAAGANCVFTITFTPTALGARGGNLTITDSAPGSPHLAPLSGIGVAGSPQFRMGGNATVGGSVRF